MTKDAKEFKKNQEDQKALFADSNVDTLVELAEAFGLGDRIPEEPTKENMLELLMAAKRADIAIAKTVHTPEGKDLECPPGHMVIKVTPKALGMEWGQRSREVFFFAVNGQCVVGKRGETVVIPDKYRSCWRDAIRHEWSVSEKMELDNSGQFIQPAKWTKHEVPAEDVMELYWNRDIEAEKRIEQELIEGSKRYMAEKAEQRALARAVQQVVR